MSKAKCMNCDTVIESRHIHDFVTCKCFRNQKENTGIFLDGGEEYSRFGGCMENLLLWDPLLAEYQPYLIRGENL
jgi:hypothetical protein